MFKIIANGSRKVQKHFNYYFMVQGFYKFKANRDSTIIQSKIRQYLAKKCLREL